MIEYISLTVAPFIATVLMFFVYIPQVMLTYRTKNVEGQDKSFWVVLSIILFCTVVFNCGQVYYKGGEILGVVSQAVNLFFSVLMMIMVYKYNKNKKGK